MPGYLPIHLLEFLSRGRKNHLAFSGVFGDSECTASDGTGLDGAGNEIMPGVKAYKKLKDIDLSCNRSYEIGFWAFGYHGAEPPDVSTRIENVKLQLIPNQSLDLDANTTDYSQEEKVSVYKGSLSLSWTEVRAKFLFSGFRFSFFPFRLRIERINKSSKLNLDHCTLRFRVDNENDKLYCFQKNDPDDAKELVCIHSEGTLENPVANVFNLVSFHCKSNYPVSQFDPEKYDIRKAKIWIY